MVAYRLHASLVGPGCKELCSLAWNGDCQTTSDHDSSPGYQPEEEIDGYAGKYFEKRKLLRRGCKCKG